MVMSGDGAAFHGTAEAGVDLGALSHNASVLAEAAGASGAAPMAVVKADGFGHGLVPAARAALAGGATWLGVTSAAEALEARAAGLTAPLLALRFPAHDEPGGRGA